jgi:hypothetical protein
MLLDKRTVIISSVAVASWEVLFTSLGPVSSPSIYRINVLTS